ncbi:PEP/pyruvate-binding domain-containing protein [Halomonas sp. hl-4]|uniref:PEP/pyruvate-binding domain-containing protein n=1 Tax=Halomonas sp. hl-4 TaxID=1761789 RepID=UPI000BB745C7|nr:PEP/pyruvate-binding domain-containing protein [Halomonas sp. hl-4]SNY98600.1 Choline kinase [Halomonas sp. hl-4]
MPKLIILGAGAPHHGKKPAALREPRSGTSMLQWILDASRCELNEATFVAGYQADAVQASYPKLTLAKNQNWENTGSGASLLVANFPTDQPLLVCYSDILFRETVPTALTQCDADIAVAWDSAWEKRYSGRAAEHLDHREKVVVNNGHIVRLGGDVPVDWADGEFIGLVRFSSKALKQLAELREKAPESLTRRHLSDYIEYLRVFGCSVAAVDVAGDWAEFNDPQDIAHFILGTKAETLSRLRGMMRHAIIQDQVACSVSSWRSNPNATLSKTRKQFGNQRVVVRSSARSEDSFYASNAGGYESLLNVDTNSELADAVNQVINSYGEAASDDQVLIQPMVTDVRISGVAFTRTLKHGAPWYVVNYETNGDTEAITSGVSSDHRTLLLRRESTEKELPEPALAGLIKALKEIESLLSYDALDIEFAIDTDNTVYILQVRPIAVDRSNSDCDDSRCHEAIQLAHTRWLAQSNALPHLPGKAAALYGVMPDWNPAEIIGTSPGALAKSLYRYLIMDETWAIQRAEYGYRDVRPAPLLTEFAGHPYVDVRASFASFLPSELSEGLAGRLLNFYTGWLSKHPELHDKVEFDVVPTCLAPGFERWEKRLKQQGGFSRDDVAQLRSGLRRITANAFQRCPQDLALIHQLSQRFDALMAEKDLPALERAYALLDDCRRLGALPFAHLARSGFVAVTLLREAQATGMLTNHARESFLSTLHTVSHELTADAKMTATGDMSWEDFKARYGHLRPGTYDITSPRYDADPERFLRPLVEHAKAAAHEKAEPHAWHDERDAFCQALADIGLPSEPELVESFLRQAIEGREYAKFIFTRNLSAALESLADVGHEYGLTREHVSHLSLNDLLTLRHSVQSLSAVADSLHQRAEEESLAQRIASTCELPPLVAKESDFEAFILGADQPNFIGSDSITANCIDLSDQPADVNAHVAGRLVLIPQADPGYDWLFGQGIAGLITLYGGANSHMAIRAAEFGLPAAIGVGEQRFRELARARVIELSPSNSILRVIQ